MSFLFIDDFNRADTALNATPGNTACGNGWIDNIGSTAQISTNRLRIDPFSGSAWQTRFILQSLGVTASGITGTLRGNGGFNIQGGMILFWGPSGSSNGNYYLGIFDGALRIYRVSGTGRSLLATTTFTPNFNHDHLITFERSVSTGLLTLSWQNTTTQVTTTVSASDTTYTAGLIGVTTGGDYNREEFWDNISIYAGLRDSVEYRFVAGLSSTDNYARLSAGNIVHLKHYQDATGTVYCFAADQANNRIVYVAFTDTGGNVSNQSVISANTLFTKSLGVNSSPNRINIYRDQNGIVYVFSSEAGSNNRVSYFPVSGSDGIIYTNQTTLNSSTIYTKTVGTLPSFTSLIRDSAGIVYTISVESTSARISYFPISGSDGIVYTSQATLNSSTVYTKSVGAQSNGNFLYRDTSGIWYVLVCHDTPGLISYFPISGTDGIVYTNQTTLNSSTVYTKSFGGARPQYIVAIRDSSGLVCICFAAFGQNRITYFSISGTDGIVYTNQTTITNQPSYNKPSSQQILTLDLYKDQNNVVWTLGNDIPNVNLVLSQISGTDGILYTDQTTLNNLPLYVRNLGPNTSITRRFPVCAFFYIDPSGDAWALSGNSSDQNISIVRLTPNTYSLSLDFPQNNYFGVAQNTMQIPRIQTFFEFDVGVTSRFLAPTYNFNYTRLSASSGRLESGSKLFFVTNTADITGGSLTFASGSTARLGKKVGPFTINLIFQSGSIIEVYPDSDRSGAALNLTNQAIASGTTINATSGTATVLVSSSTGLIAGPGVTIQAPTVTYVRAVSGVPAGCAIAMFARSQPKFANTSQYTLASGNNSGNGTVVIQQSIPADTPSSGFIRLYDTATDTEQRYAYSSRTGSTFTLTGTLNRNYSTGAGAYVGYLDVLGSSAGTTSVSLPYVSDRDVVLCVRIGSGSGKLQEFRVDLTLTNQDVTIPFSAIADTINQS